MTDPKKQGISLAAATAIVVASMVGTGVFTSLGFQLSDIPAGFPIVMLWIIGGLASLCGAFCYAELGAMMPRSGGEYHLLGKAYHPALGFLAGWVSATAGFAAPIAAAALLFGSYVHDIVPVLDEKKLATLLVLAVMVVQLCHLRFVGGFQLTFTMVKVLLILVFVGGALILKSPEWHLLAPKTGDGAYFLKDKYAVALVYVMYAYAGWNGAAYVVGEMRDPKRNLPLALVFGTLIVTVLYVALNAVFLVDAPWDAMKGQERVALVAARHIFGQNGGDAMGALISLGLLAHVSAMMLAGTRVLKVIGQDAWLLRWLDHSNRHGAPWISVVFMTAVVMTFMYVSTFQQLLIYIEGLLILSSLLCVAAVPWLRWRRPEADRPFKTPLYPLTPIVFILVAGLMLAGMLMKQPKETAWGVITLAVGILVYILSPANKRRPGGSGEGTP